MFKRLLARNYFNTFILSIFIFCFILFVFLFNYNKNVDPAVVNAYNDLPFFIKIFFLIFLPIFSDFEYLFQFSLFYIIPLTIIFSFLSSYTLKTRNKVEGVLPINENKKKIYYLLSGFIHTLIIMAVVLFSYIWASLACYGKLHSRIFSALIILLLWNIVFYLIGIILQSKSGKSVTLTITIICLWIITTIILASFFKAKIFLYLSLIQTIITPSNFFLSVIQPILIIGILSYLTTKKKMIYTI